MSVRAGRMPCRASSANARAASSTVTVPLMSSAAPGDQASRCPPTTTHSSGNLAPRIIPNVSQIGCMARAPRSVLTRKRARTGPGPT